MRAWQHGARLLQASHEGIILTS